MCTGRQFLAPWLLDTVMARVRSLCPCGIMDPAMGLMHNFGLHRQPCPSRQRQKRKKLCSGTLIVNAHLSSVDRRRRAQHAGQDTILTCSGTSAPGEWYFQSEKPTEPTRSMRARTLQKGEEGHAEKKLCLKESKWDVRQ